MKKLILIIALLLSACDQVDTPFDTDCTQHMCEGNQLYVCQDGQFNPPMQCKGFCNYVWSEVYMREMAHCDREGVE